MDNVRPPKQRRSRETLVRFLDASRELMNQKHFDAISVSEIAERAGSSVGAFYSRFPDKKALLAHLEEVFLRETADEARRLSAAKDWESTPLEAVTLELVRVLVQQYRKHRGTLRALITGAMTGRPATAAGLGFDAPLAIPFLDLLRRRRGEIGHPNPDIAVHLGMGMVTSAVRERVLFPEIAAGPKHSGPLTDAVFVEEVARAFLGFLGVNATTRSE